MFVNVGSARIYFDVVGSQLRLAGERVEARPTLIVMHGGPGFDHTTLRPYFDRFSDSHQVLYLDHRGNGRSSGEPHTWTLAQWGADVKRVCDALGIEKPVVYGNSFGGMVAMSYAVQFPQHPSRLILSSTAARMHLPATYAMMEARGGAHAREVAERFWSAPDEQTLAEYIAVCMPLYNPTRTPEEAEARKRALVRPEVARHFVLGEMRTMDAREALKAISCPTLVLAGGYDPITPPVCSEEIAGALRPGVGEYRLLRQAGHGVHRDDPAGAETLLRAFLAQGAGAPAAAR
jgi:pimeloyl-ACP methyl ester carboxylesterase